MKISLLCVFLIMSSSAVKEEEEVCTKDICQVYSKLESDVLQRDKLILQLSKNLEESNSKLEELSSAISNIQKRLPTLPLDCLDVQYIGSSKSGVYSIYPGEGEEIKVFCDMETDGGGWTVLLDRQKQSEQLNFNRTWDDYKNGFGSASKEYWIGLETLHRLTTSKPYSMRLDAVVDGSPSKLSVEYLKFKVASEDQKYRLTLRNYNSDKSNMATMGFDYNDGSNFTTIDSHNGRGDFNCAADKIHGDGGGFWYNWCSYHYPTRPYGKIRLTYWSRIRKTVRDVISLQMKFRPRQ